MAAVPNRTETRLAAKGQAGQRQVHEQPAGQDGQVVVVGMRAQVELAHIEDGERGVARAEAGSARVEVEQEWDRHQHGLDEPAGRRPRRRPGHALATGRGRVGHRAAFYSSGRRLRRRPGRDPRLTSGTRRRSVDARRVATMATCPTCAHLTAEGQRFCPSCGAPLAADSLPTGTAPRPHPSPDRVRRPGRALPPAPRTPRRRRPVARRLERDRRAGGPAASALPPRRAALRRPLPDRRPARPRRDGRGLSRGRPAARAGGRPQVPARVARTTTRAARAVLQRGAHGAAGLASRRLPRLRHRRGGRPARSSPWSTWTARTWRRCCGASAGCPRTRRWRSRGSSAPASPPPTSEGVLHRDLKPDNVMLDGRGKVRITDFGLAGLAESFGGDEVRSGTPAYMSPEQLAGREVTAASDIYALGLVLYELFTGRKAFDGTHPGRADRASTRRRPRPAPRPRAARSIPRSSA